MEYEDSGRSIKAKLSMRSILCRLTADDQWSMVWGLPYLDSSLHQDTSERTFEEDYKLTEICLSSVAPLVNTSCATTLPIYSSLTIRSPNEQHFFCLGSISNLLHAQSRVDGLHVVPNAQFAWSVLVPLASCRHQYWWRITAFSRRDSLCTKKCK